MSEYCKPDRMVAISKTRGEWILYIDTDERVSPELKNEILTTISSEMKGYNCYYLPRKTHFLLKYFFILFFLKPLYWFVKKYIFWRGFQDGFRGFFICFSSALTIFVAYSKLWEIEQAKK